jgi:hypothetical protein
MLALMPIRTFAQFNGAFTEAYDIARRVEIVGRDSRRYRLDVFEDAGSNTPPSFCVRCYVEKEVTISGETYEIWVSQELPWVDSQTPEEALAQGMVFLASIIAEK